MRHRYSSALRFAGLPLKTLTYHIALAPEDGYDTPEHHPEKWDGPTDAVGGRGWDRVDDGDDGERDGNDDGRDTPE